MLEPGGDEVDLRTLKRRAELTHVERSRSVKKESRQAAIGRLDHCLLKQSDKEAHTQWLTQLKTRFTELDPDHCRAFEVEDVRSISRISVYSGPETKKYCASALVSNATEPYTYEVQIHYGPKRAQHPPIKLQTWRFDCLTHVCVTDEDEMFLFSVQGKILWPTGFTLDTFKTLEDREERVESLVLYTKEARDAYLLLRQLEGLELNIHTLSSLPAVTHKVELLRDDEEVPAELRQMATDICDKWTEKLGDGAEVERMRLPRLPADRLSVKLEAAVMKRLGINCRNMEGEHERLTELLIRKISINEQFRAQLLSGKMTPEQAVEHFKRHLLQMDVPHKTDYNFKGSRVEEQTIFDADQSDDEEEVSLRLNVRHHHKANVKRCASPLSSDSEDDEPANKRRKQPAIRID